MNKYEECRGRMSTGDVIAFSGKGRVSEIIKWKTGSPFSHVGMVLDTDMQGGIGKAVLLIESTSLNNISDASHGELLKGVQMHFLSNRLGSYDGKAWWFPLKNKLSNHGAHNMQQWLRKKHDERTPYDTIQAIGAGADLFDWIPGLQTEPDFSSLFCSELVTRALQIAGVVCEGVNPSEQTPADVVGFECVGQGVEL